MLSLCLSISSAPTAKTKLTPHRTIVQLDESSSVETLFQTAHDAVVAGTNGTKKSKNKNHISAISIKVGFPPQDLTRLPDRTLQACGIRNQDRITVIVSDDNSKKNNKKKASSKSTKTTTKASPKKNKETQKRAAATSTTEDDDDDNYNHDEPQSTTTTTNNNSSTLSSPPASKRSRRAAAQKATDSFAAVIRAQDKMMRETASPKKKTRSGSAPRINGNNSKTTQPQPRFKAAATTGRRLEDGATVVTAAAARAAARKRKQQEQQSHVEAPADHSRALVDTLESRSKAGRLMRNKWRQAVDNQYRQNTAVSRLAAIPHAVTFELLDDGRKLQATFAKGVQGRGNHQETIDYIPRDLLKETMGVLYQTELEDLRPENMALSPRILWNLVYHHQQQQQREREQPEQERGNRNSNGSVEEALVALQPSLDWSFLRTRKKELSAKAKENLRQAQEKDAQKSSSNIDDNWEAAAATIASVEEAMEKLQELDHNHRQSRIRDAAQVRQSQKQNDGEEWKLNTPSEVDEDELLECVNENLPDNGPSADTIVRHLIDKCHIRNWRELANYNDSEADKMAQELGVETVHVDSWLTMARQQSVEEIIVEVCDKNVDAVPLLRHVNAGTPHELTHWQPIAEELETLLRDSATEGTAEEIPSAVQLQKWCDQAELALNQWPWLKDFVATME
mmetsp:Transcript_14211/g.39382  ORF Transcript_14211/g.39382 Transcript_14211/m.39382 type:complete len:680 (-) Transcript_14211:565-2604(-)